MCGRAAKAFPATRSAATILTTSTWREDISALRWVMWQARECLRRSWLRLIQGIFSAQTFLDAPLPAILGNVNRKLVQRGTGSRFVTFFFGILDSDGNCTYVNAGHNPPFLLGRDGSMRELTAGGMVLGLFAGAQYEAETIKLQPDDHLVLFTDGVIEALNTAGEEFGMERLTALLQANAQSTTPQILARLQEAVLSFSADAPQHDDITMMVLGFRESR